MLVVQLYHQPADTPEKGVASVPRSAANVFGTGTARSAMSNSPEQRRQVRMRADYVIRFTLVRGPARTPETARMVDVSEGGMSFVAPRYLIPGTSLKIEFGDCRLLAEVRHCRLREYGAISQFFTGVQVQQVLEGSETWMALTQAAI